MSLFIRPAYAWPIAIFASSIAFSAAHHIGEYGEAFTFSAFVFRFFAGVFFALVYRVRGAGVAVWTHCLYDAWVFSLS